MKLIDITGATFGRLTVVGRGQNVAGRASLRCAPLTFGGETMDWKEWAARLGLHPSAISQRLRKGWDVERAFTTPKIGARP